MEMKSEAKLTTFEAISMIVPQRRQAHHRGGKYEIYQSCQTESSLFRH